MVYYIKVNILFMEKNNDKVLNSLKNLNKAKNPIVHNNFLGYLLAYFTDYDNEIDPEELFKVLYEVKDCRYKYHGMFHANKEYSNIVKLFFESIVDYLNADSYIELFDDDTKKLIFGYSTGILPNICVYETLFKDTRFRFKICKFCKEIVGVDKYSLEYVSDRNEDFEPFYKTKINELYTNTHFSSCCLRVHEFIYVDSPLISIVMKLLKAGFNVDKSNYYTDFYLDPKHKEETIYISFGLNDNFPTYKKLKGTLENITKDLNCEIKIEYDNCKLFFKSKDPYEDICLINCKIHNFLNKVGKN